MSTLAAKTLSSSGADDPYLSRLEGVEFQPVFIIGPQRSGTTALYRVLARTGLFNVTTLYHILNRHRLLRIHFSGREEQARQEVMELLQRVDLLGTEQNSEQVGPDVLEEYCFAFDHVGRRPILNDSNLLTFIRFCQKLQVIQEPSRPLLLKNPFDTPNFLYIHEKFPHARYVFLYRHPADIVNSTVRLLRSIFKERDEYVALTVPRYDRLCHNPVKMALARFIYSDRFPLLVRQVSDSVSRSCTYMADHKEVLGGAAIGVTYTEMCNQPNQVVHRILDFLGLVEKVPQDYSRLIRQREPSLLPEVQKVLASLERRNAAYLRAAALPEIARR